MRDTRQVMVCQHGPDARKRQRSACIDMANIRVRMGRVQDASVQHSWLLKLSRINRRARHKWARVHAPLLLADHARPRQLTGALVFSISDIASTRFVVGVIHNAYYAAIVLSSQCTIASSGASAISFFFCK